MRRVREAGSFRVWLVGAYCLMCMLLMACRQDLASDPANPEVEGMQKYADVLSVQVTGKDHAYQFSVEVLSPDTGCSQYTDWWEVLSDDGTLLYRRILTHSHTDEQPFVRSGGPIDILNTTEVIVRAHMEPGGYGGIAQLGSPVYGFEPAEIPADFASDVMSEEPLPDGCTF